MGLVAVLLTVGLGSDADNVVRLTKTGACGNARFWAASADGKVAIVVEVGAMDRSTDQPLESDIDGPGPSMVDAGSPPSGEISVRVDRGINLFRLYCTDLPGNARRTSRDAATKAAGWVVLEPPSRAHGSPPVHGTLRIEGVEARDGTRFDPVDISTSSIGALSG